MKRYICLLLAILLLPGLLSCSSVPLPNPLVSPTPTPTPAPTPTPVGPPSPYTVLEDYLKAWEQGRYGDMYDLLSADAQAGITRDRFVQRYQAITEGSTILSVKSSFNRDEQLSRAQGSADLPYSVVMSTARLGEIRQENSLPAVYEGERWRVNWSPSLIFKELGKDDRILFTPDDPVRGSILDRKGRPLATSGKMVSVGVVPNQITDEAAMLAALQQQLKIDPARAKAAYQGAQPDWFVPVKDLTEAEVAGVRPKLEEVPGIAFQEKSARVYPNGSTAAHIIGYMSQVTAEDLKTLAARGYGEADLVGRAGIEGSAEAALAGERGGKLSVVSAAGQTVKTIAQKPAKNGQNVQLGLDLDVQKLAEDALGTRAGSAVILDVKDNSVLAMASYPRFDPNQFITGFSSADWKKLNEDPLHPFQNRPIENAQPIGSLFKVVTMAGGLERGGFTAQSEFDCNGQWVVPGSGQVMGDWLPGGHGRLNLFQGLVQSCNIVFYEVGLKLDSVDPNLLPELARGFGYGKATGLNGLAENPGLVPDPAWKKANRNDDWYLGDSINLSIGQGFFLATPLQAANAFAALARGGAILSPLLVTKQGDQSFQAQPKGQLPVPAQIQDTIRQAMAGVVSDPKGNAYKAFQGAKVSVAAKTGSAEVGDGKTHAWYAAFAPTDQPQMALIVMIENVSGLSSEFAAPVARKIVDGYFSR